MNTIGRKGLVIGMVACVILLVGLAASHFVTELGWHNSIDYGRQNPSQVFQFVTDMPVPHGVSNLRVAGHSYPGRAKHWIRMRFNVTDEALDKLINGPADFTGGEALPFIRMSMNLGGSTKYEESDIRHVGWHEVHRIPNAEVYVIGDSSTNSDFVLLTYLIPDRHNHIAYIFAVGD